MSKKLEHLWVKHLDFTPLNGLFFFFFKHLFTWFLYLNHSMNHKRKRFKVFEVGLSVDTTFYTPYDSGPRSPMMLKF